MGRGSGTEIHWHYPDGEVGGEFVKLYKMIFAEKEISGEEYFLNGLKEHKLVQSSRRMLVEPFTETEAARVMENLPVAK